MSNPDRKRTYREAVRLARHPRWRRFVRYRGPAVLRIGDAEYHTNVEFAYRDGAARGGGPIRLPNITLVGEYTVTWPCT